MICQVMYSLSSLTELVGSIVAVFVVAVLYEGLKTVREVLMYYDSKKAKLAKMHIQDETTSLLTKGTSTDAGNQGHG